MHFKDISNLDLWLPFCSAERNHLCNFGRRHHEEQFCEIILNLDPCSKTRCSLKIFLILSCGSPFVQRSGTILCYFCRGHYEEQFWDYFEFGPVVQEEMSFKRFLIWSSGSPPVQWSSAIYAILKEGIMENILVKLYEIRTSGSGDFVQRTRGPEGPEALT